jgi:hypothetical protein
VTLIRTIFWLSDERHAVTSANVDGTSENFNVQFFDCNQGRKASPKLTNHHTLLDGDDAGNLVAGSWRDIWDTLLGGKHRFLSGDRDEKRQIEFAARLDR